MSPSTAPNCFTRNKLIAFVFVNLLIGAIPAFAANWAWSTSPGSANFNANNWTSGTTPGTATGKPAAADSLYFGTSSQLTPNNDYTVDTAFNGITFNSGANAFTIGGNEIQLGGNIVNSSGSLQTINLNMVQITANRTVTANSGGSDMALGGVVSGAFTLIKGGTGTLTLSGNNTCSAVQINAGTLKLGLNNALPTTGTGLVIGGTATQTFDLNSHSQTLGGMTLAGTGGASAAGNISDSVGGGSLTLSGTLTQNATGLGGTIAVPVNLNGATRTFNIQNSSYSVTISKAISTSSGTAGLIKSGAGTLILSGPNTYNGDTTISAGTLELDSAALSSSASVKITTGATLNLNFSGTATVGAFYIDGVQQSYGTYNHSSNPTLITGSGSLQVPTPVSAGNWTGLGTDNNWSTGGNWDNAVQPIFPIALTFAGSTRLTPNNDLTGITVNGITLSSTASAFTIGGNDITLGGNIAFSANPASPITQTINLNMVQTANRNVTSQANGNITLGGVISGAFTFIKGGSGVVTLAGNNTCNAVQINSGTLNLGLNNALPTTGTGLVIAGSSGTQTFDMKGYSQTLGGITLAGAGATAVASITDSVGGGSLTLNGTLTQNSTGLGGTISVPVNLNGASGTFNIQNASYPVTVSGVISTSSGTAGLTKAGAGTLILSGANTYNGDTIITNGTLALNGTALITNTANIVVASNAVFDVSGLSIAFTLASALSSQTLSNSAPGAIISGTNNCSVGTISLVYDGVNPCFDITNGGMTLSTATIFNVNNTGTQLTVAGSPYKIISKATAGNVGLVAGAVIGSSVTVNGNGAAGTATLGITGGELFLNVATAQSPSTISYSVVGPFTYNVLAQTPTISFSGSTGIKTTNYTGVGATSYGPTATAPVNAGTYALTNTMLADANYYGTTNGVTFTIYPAPASVTADAKTKTYGSVNPGLTATVVGQVVGGDTINFTLNTDAIQYSAVGVSNIMVNLGSNPNYTLLTTNSTLTINPATTFVGAFSSENPSGYKDTVIYTATLPADATGSVVFSSTNGAFSTNAISSGSATSLSISNLSRGTNVITVAYLGDGNYLGSTTNIDQNVTNHPPVANVMAVTRTAGLALIIKISDIATNWSDVDGDTVELTSVTMQTTNGVNLFPLNWITNLDGSIVTTDAYAYIGYTNSPNVNDQISYGISDGQGGTNIGYVNIAVQGSVTGTNSITAYNFTSPSSNTVTAYGIPYFYYILERSTNLSSTVWVDVQTNQAAPNGVINMVDQFIDLGGIKPNPAFYQLKWQP